MTRLNLNLKGSRFPAVVLACLGWAYAPAQQSSPLTRDMGIHQMLGASVPADDTFVDESGKQVRLGQFFGKTPLLVLPIFYGCRSYCAVQTDSLLQTLMKASHPTGLMGMATKANDHVLKLGRDLEVVMISINPQETPALAANKKSLIENALHDKEEASHFHLLTGTYANIRRFTDSIGFQYHYDAAKDLIRHPTASVILTPSGKVSSYVIGYEFPRNVLTESLALAARDEVAARPADQTSMFGCLQLDPVTGRTTVVIEGVMRVAGVLTVLVLGSSIFLMLRSERKAGLVSGVTRT